MQNIIFYFIIGIIIFDFILSRILDMLNNKRWSDSLPDELKDLYNPEEYKKSQNYHRENNRLGHWKENLSLVIVLALLFFQGFAFIDQLVAGFSSSYYIHAISFFALLAFASDIISTPFNYYDTFVIEEKYGFNKTTKKLFWMDKLKGWLLSMILGGGIMTLIIFFYKKTGSYFWIYAWAAVTFFMIFFVMFYSNLIVPLFNKQTPLPEGDLRKAIEEFSERAGFKLNNIFVIDGSKRSTKANAYFSGLGAKKRIVLFDTLINDLSVSEIVAVLAHEVGHYKKKHTLSGMILSILQTGATLYILSVFINNPVLSQVLGAEEQSFHMGLISFGILFSPISTILGLFMNVVSRKNEYQADKYAKSYGLANDLVSALKKLSVKNLSNLNPHPAYVFVHYSHPPLMDRIKALYK